MTSKTLPCPEGKVGRSFKHVKILMINKVSHQKILMDAKNQYYSLCKQALKKRDQFLKTLTYTYLFLLF